MKNNYFKNAKVKKDSWPIVKPAIDSASVFVKQLGPVLPERKYEYEESERDISKLIELLSWCRMAGTKTIRRFEREYLIPIFGKADSFGNYMLTIGNNPRVAFMAHYDSVHRMGGIQKITIGNGYARLHKDAQSNCLGADCATGIWLILEMIKEGIEGRYIIHADEETGCGGSKSLAQSNPDWLYDTDAAISFDRKDTCSIITHQIGGRTASDQFALSLATILGMDLEADPTGSFTDSNEYADSIPECTNLSVGYYRQHSKDEIQDLRFAAILADRLIDADWSLLAIERKPGDYDMPKNKYGYDLWDSYDSDWNRDYGKQADKYSRSNLYTNFEDMIELVESNPEAIASMLVDQGYDSNSLAHEIGDALFGRDRESI